MYGSVVTAADRRSTPVGGSFIVTVGRSGIMVKSRMVLVLAGSAIPLGCYRLDGQAVSRIELAFVFLFFLFAVTGTAKSSCSKNMEIASCAESER